MNIPVGLVDENGKIHYMVMRDKFLSDLSVMLRQEGITPVHTSDDKGNLKTYQAQAVILMSKGCKGHMMFIPDKD
ncbi:hypothetical protein ACFFJY_09190 [Fictibacillus aquaticus]|uniref:Uncharacterized protein n=1 Tax=Fictibacillus aquaticus TaxID=2021314 RepID=A0A235FB35_9BACL|nr:hypothetical protein [Fictibacillus aquaticus]OYD58452.1 hypothetical protein CGZ90_00695 [Fictibacillus aquaticus]